jgi:hypothetical protein
MHRLPTPKAQANIVRQAFAENGVELAHRKALDVVARLNGHASWNVMSAHPEPAAAEPIVVPAAVVPVPKAPRRRAGSVAEGPLKRYEFEAIGYVPTRKQMTKLDEVSFRCPSALWAAVEERANALGFTNVGIIGIEEDEGQDDEDIKVFVGVELYGRTNLRENDSASAELASVLSELCEPMLLDAKGELITDPSDWEVLSIDSDLETVPNTRRSYVFEGVGFVGTREMLKLLQSTIAPTQEMWAKVESDVGQFGFDMVGNIDLCEDDGAHDTNIRVYVCIRLKGRSYLTEDMPLPSALIQALAVLTDPLTCLPDGSKAFAPMAWELSSIDSPGNPMLMPYA